LGGRGAATAVRKSGTVGTATTLPKSGTVNPHHLTLPPDLKALRQAVADTASHHLPTPPPTRRPEDTLDGSRGRVDLFDRNSRGPAESCPDASVTQTTLSSDAIPGYRIDGVIGYGGMGTVYVARQMSLDRPVALKVMSRVWASDPVFVARFVREAYAAAQLNHTNVVQIYDIGEVGESRYFSMEYVAGRSLAEVVKAQGKLDVETAVGYVLQAARGLKHAHDRGIIHRDVKPDNLLLDAHGVVKVADLGLVKTPDLAAQQDRLADPSRSQGSGLHTLPPDMTGVRMALGTPAYMAPEQCRDAAAVDHRADIYSLGCTLYALVTGTQPFHAPDAMGLMKKHAYEPMIPPEHLNPRVPAEVSAVIQKMMAKAPGDRYRTVGEVIRTLEQWLGVQTNGKFVPREDQIAEVERLAARFYASPAAAARRRAVNGFLSASAIAAVLLTFFGQTAYAFGLAGLVLQSAAAYFALNGVTRKTYLFGRVRRFAAGLSAGDWIVGVGAVGLFVAFLAVSDLLAVWAGFGLIGVAAAVVLRYGFDQRVDVERFPPLEAADQLVRRLRKQGVAEREAKGFFAKYAGRRWEEFFEGVFGYEAKVQTRADLRGGAAGTRDKFAAWREPVVALLNHVETQRKKARERDVLERAEYHRLVAAGVPKGAARDRAAAAAAALVEQASVIRESELNRPDAPSQATPSFRPFLQPSLSDVSLGVDPHPRDPVGWVLDLLVGKPVRGVLAAVLVAACGWWVYQNDLIRLGRPTGVTETAPLSVPGVPPAWTSWCDTVNAGWGGVLLLASLFYRGHRTAALCLLGAGVAVFGHKLGIRTVEPVRDYHVAMLLGTVLSLIGYRLGRR
jgi:serine/threonine protein kinase